MRHRIQTPATCDCHTEDRCPICDGGLMICEVCNGAEAAMPSECPGRPLTADESDAIQAGTLDYVDGIWNPRTILRHS